MTVRMEIKGLMLDPVSNMPIVVLRDPDNKVFLPIWVGVFEANAIALQIENVQTPRPMTHDLLRSVIDSFHGSVERIVIDGLRESTFFAKIYLSCEGNPRIIDCRPSDAIALALRTSAPIFVEDEVLKAAQLRESGGPSGDEGESIRRQLEEMNIEELGKYKM